MVLPAILILGTFPFFHDFVCHLPSIAMLLAAMVSVVRSRTCLRNEDAWYCNDDNRGGLRNEPLDRIRHLPIGTAMMTIADVSETSSKTYSARSPPGI